MVRLSDPPWSEARVRPHPGKFLGSEHAQAYTIFSCIVHRCTASEYLKSHYIDYNANCRSVFIGATANIIFVGGACMSVVYRCVNQKTMRKGTFFELGSAQRCHHLG